jgi:hypothetical protein
MLSLPSITAPSRHRLAVTVDSYVGPEAVEDMAAGLGVDAAGGEQILDAERDALQRAACAARQFRVAGFRHGERLVGRLGHVGVERASPLHRRQIGARQLGRAAGFLRQRLAGLGDRQFGQVGHSTTLGTTK